MTEGFRVDLERMRQVYEEDRRRAEQGVAAQSITRVVGHIVQDVEIEVRVGRFTLRSDEPAERGGSGMHPTPLQYFAAGLAT